MLPIRRPDLAELETLVLAADGGSVAAAAAALQISRAAASKRLRTLEALVGEPLLERTSRGVVPTEAGRALILSARSVLSESNAMVVAIAERKQGSGSRSTGRARFLADPSRLPLRAPTIMESLADTQRLVGEIIHSSPVPMTVSEPNDGPIIDANAAYAELTGIPVSDMIGSNFAALDVAAHPEDIWQIIDMIDRREDVNGLLALLRRRDDELRVVLVSAWESLVGGRRLIFSTYEDITERRRAETEAAALRKIVTLSRDYISLVVETHTFTALNPAGRELVGIPHDADISTIEPLELKHPSMPDAAIDAIRETMDAHDSWSGTFILRNLVTGEAIPAEAAMFYIRGDDDSKVPLVATVARPVEAPR